MAFAKCIVRNSKKKILILDCFHSTQIFNEGNLKREYGLGSYLEVDF